MSDRLVWDRDGRDWPHRSASRFVQSGGLTWHVQTIGSGPDLLLVHGTGASTHSWRRLMPILAERFKVIAPDLPGHGFTQMPNDASALSLPGMSAALSGLIAKLDARPAIAIGHSAGAAILIRAAIDGEMAPKVIVSLNGALLPFGHWVGQLFSPLAKLLATAPLAPRIMAWRAANREAVSRVLTGTGSRLQSEDIDLYARLFRNPVHVAAALRMMANWNLAEFARDLPRLTSKLILVAGSNDAAVRPDVAERAAKLVRCSKVVYAPGLGHLAHEEAPAHIARIIFAAARERGDTRCSR